MLSNETRKTLIFIRSSLLVIGAVLIFLGLYELVNNGMENVPLLVFYFGMGTYILVPTMRLPKP